TPLKATPGGTIEGARIAGPKGFLDRLATVAPQFTIQPRIHSLALRLPRGAHGTVDVVLPGPPGPAWDPAASGLLVREAGGALTTIGGTTLAYNGTSTVHDVLLAAGLVRHQTLTVLLRNHPDLLR